MGRGKGEDGSKVKKCCCAVVFPGLRDLQTEPADPKTELCVLCVCRFPRKSESFLQIKVVLFCVRKRGCCRETVTSTDCPPEAGLLASPQDERHSVHTSIESSGHGAGLSDPVLSLHIGLPFLSPQTYLLSHFLQGRVSKLTVMGNAQVWHSVPSVLFLRGASYVLRGLGHFFKKLIL